MGLFIPDKAFENVTRAQISRLKDPSMKCVSSVVKELKSILSFCIEKMSTYPKLHEETEKILMQHVNDCEERCKQHLDIAIKIELGHLNIKHGDFVRPEEAQKTAENTSTSSLKSLFASSVQHSSLTIEQMDERKIKQEAQQFKIMIDSYLKIVTKNIHDLVPKTIMYFVIDNMKKFIEDKLIVKLFITNNKYPLTELSQGEEKRREELRRTRDAFEQALERIDKVSSSATSSLK